MIVFIDRQHAGKPDRLNDRGATVDCDHDGSPDMEAMITARLAIQLEQLLMLHGHMVMPISDGTYTQRHKRVNEYAAMYPDQHCIYLAMHLNAGGGTYGAFFHHHASKQGAALANHIGRQMMQNNIDITDCKTIAAHPSGWTKNAFYTIRGVGRPVALCCEPVFMDSPRGKLDNITLARIADAMATGIHQYFLEL